MEKTMEKMTFAKIMGLAVSDDGIPTYGYVKLEGVQLQRETLARIFGTTPDTVVMLTEEEYTRESESDE